MRVWTLPMQLLRGHTRLLLRFVAASAGRAALSSSVILLIHEFLAGVLGKGGGIAARYGVSLSPWTTVGLLAVAQLGSVLFTYDSKVSEQKIAAVVELGAIDRLIRHILTLSAGFFERRTHGDLVQSIRQDVTQLRAVTTAVSTIVFESLLVAGMLFVAARLSLSLAVWAFVLVPVAVLPIAAIARRALARSFGVRRRSVAIFDSLLQLLHGIRTIRIYQSEQAEAERTIERARRYFDELLAMEQVRALARVVLESLGSVGMVAVVIVGGFQVMRGTLGWPDLLAFLIAARAVHGPLNNVNTAYMEIQRHGASVANIDALLREQPEIRDRPDARPLPGAPMTIAVRELGFVIGEVPVLENVSFEIRAGETLGIVGPSGAGKTTLLNMLARLHDPTTGAVLLDGLDLRDLRLADVYAKIALVSQDPFLFPTTIADNIRCGRPTASGEEVERAARAAEIHDDIMAMPDAYDTLVGHGGRGLSRGEAQRISIARAILKNAPILLMDEATSSLDSFSESRVQLAVDHLVSGRMAISVAHRLSTLRNATRILVLEEGRAVGFGTHADLVAQCATYRRLWHAQADQQADRQVDRIPLTAAREA